MSAQPRTAATRVCRTCNRELPLNEGHFRPARTSISPEGFRRQCRGCEYASNNRREAAYRQEAISLRKATPGGKWSPRVMGQAGPEGGFTEHPEEGYRFVCIPDSHGYLADPEAISAALAFVRYYRPVRIFCLGDHVDFASISRFDKPPSDIARIGEDLAACTSFMKQVRDSAPDARIHYLKGNHEARFARFLWKHQEVAALFNAQGMDLPRLLGLGDLNIEWEESGALEVTPALIVKHGHVVRQRSGYTATGELERNGISGISGHTHRLGQVYKRSRAGVMTWVESGCLCRYDPDYMEGQVSDWQQGLSFGTVSLKGRGFTVHTAPIIKGRVKALGADIGE